MKRLILMISVLALLLAGSIGCSGTGTTKAPQLTPNQRGGIEMARSAARIVAEGYLQSSYAVPAPVTAAALDVLDKSVIDPALDGGTFNLVIDPVAWAPARAKLVSEGAKALVSVKTKGVSIVDQATAEFVVGQLVDGIAAAAKANISQPATAPTQDPPATSTTAPPATSTGDVVAEVEKGPTGWRYKTLATAPPATSSGNR